MSNLLNYNYKLTVDYLRAIGFGFDYDDYYNLILGLILQDEFGCALHELNKLLDKLHQFGNLVIDITMVQILVVNELFFLSSPLAGFANSVAYSLKSGVPLSRYTLIAFKVPKGCCICATQKMFDEMLHLDIRNWTAMTLAYVLVGEAKELAASNALIISCFALGTLESRSIESICVALANLLCSNKVPNGSTVAVISDIFFKLDKIFVDLLRKDSSMRETIALALLGLMNQNMIIVQS
ncbi:hypothetical protein Syun_014533 [Stephania yunnanensis]|uniref:Uncharacterized protein n=1 Tax=Stephania yunnanensis TaxID=152371 RepID=A0AAP0P8N1_9MAGN